MFLSPFQAFHATYKVIPTENDFTFRFIVENLFDRSAPYPAPTGGGLTTYFDGIMGRYFKVAATFGF